MLSLIKKHIKIGPHKPFDRVFRIYDSFMKFWKLYKKEEIIGILDLKSNEVIADIGAGTGYISNCLSPFCKKIYAIDESKKMLLKIKPDPGIIPVRADASSTGCQDNSCDIVLLIDILHHIQNQQKLINEMKRILKPGGKLLLLDFNIEHIKTKILKLLENLLFGKLYFQNRDYFRNLFLKNGFAEKSCIQFSNSFLILWEKNNREV